MAAKQGGAGTRKHGRDLAKCKRYRDHQTREKNKIKKILQSNGVDYAAEWAKKYGAIALLNKLIQSKRPDAAL